ncbi:hypothetical protein [Arthrobacter sp. HMWF013]|uniref:hypothetical protein n=1 Tax=Arthrobacter sp. HMWF013 TaxID=2056849 RepID=UPI000D338BE5|nr:hypothetical protein [Arthrobacter sp. HMWF013]PTT69910.1 hypothetical protein DBR22_02530 [Arthrobacter sp. HMWF013]
MTPAKSGTRGRVRGPLQAAADFHPEDALDAYPAEDWSAITVGATVEVTPSEGPPYRGRVDAKTTNSAIVWVVGLDGTGRQMHGNREGVRLLPTAV